MFCSLGDFKHTNRLFKVRLKESQLRDLDINFLPATQRPIFIFSTNSTPGSRLCVL